MLSLLYVVFEMLYIMYTTQVVGRELLIHLIGYLVTNSQSDRTIGELLRLVRIHILVSMNPDGFAQVHSQNDRHCIGINGRYAITV